MESTDLLLSAKLLFRLQIFGDITFNYINLLNRNNYKAIFFLNNDLNLYKCE